MFLILFSNQTTSPFLLRTSQQGDTHTRTHTYTYTLPTGFGKLLSPLPPDRVQGEKIVIPGNNNPIPEVYGKSPNSRVLYKRWSSELTEQNLELLP